MPIKQESRANLPWAGKSASSRGPKPSLSTDQIARAAIRLADAEGLASVTMQRLARELGMTTMALYRYFPSKANLLALMIDSVSDPKFEFGGPSMPWDTRLKQWAGRCLAIYQDHPWFLEATTVRETPIGPNELDWMEAAMAMLAESGLRPKERQHAFLAIIAHVRGHATFEQIARRRAAGQEGSQGLAEVLRTQEHRYRSLLEVFHSGAFNQSSGAFDFGLDCILDGIRARIAGIRSRTRSAPTIV